METTRNVKNRIKALYESVGRGFESLPSHQKKRSKIKEKTFFFGKYKNILKKLLTNPALRDKIHHVPNGTYALVAQLDRVTDYESVGRGFESLPSHQKMP